jgi:hypothetical protein
LYRHHDEGVEMKTPPFDVTLRLSLRQWVAVGQQALQNSGEPMSFVDAAAPWRICIVSIGAVDDVEGATAWLLGHDTLHGVLYSIGESEASDALDVLDAHLTAQHRGDELL